ncbi:MAG: anthranilate synthase component I [Gammaproteobacteria bacterium]|nr:anthranilate synthase component I [Gammaproteobacteria bacterium]
MTEQTQTRHDIGGRRIPVVREVLADLDTPLSCYLKLAQGRYSYLLESVQGGEKWGRYSLIGLPAHVCLRVSGDCVQLERDGIVVERFTSTDMLGAVRDFLARFSVAPDPALPRFHGGLVGYFGYEMVRQIEPSLGEIRKPDDSRVPDALFLLSDEVVIFDNLRGTLSLIVYVDAAGGEIARARAQERLDELEQRLRAPFVPPQSMPVAPLTEADFVSGFTRGGFEAAVERCREYIRAGDVMQVALSQRMSAPAEFAPLDLYRALRRINPSPYMYLLDFGDFQVVGSSPEILAQRNGDEIVVRPIAGTRRRGRDPHEDEMLAEELLADPKEIAEHVMLVDLGRNDVGRVSVTGSVTVTDQMTIERYSHVMHIVSNVTGRLRPELDAFDVLRATFPAGTLTGAPKVRAMEIIDELEPVKRGVYAGAVGYVGWHGNMDMAIAIRTAVIRDRRLYLQVGAGIVADSVAASEWEETLNKARAMIRAAQLAANGLDGNRPPR